MSGRERGWRRIRQAACVIALAATPLFGAGAQAAGGMPSHTEVMDLDRKIRVFMLADLLEYVPGSPGSIRGDALAWIGGDYNRVFMRLDGEEPLKGSGGETALDVTYGRLVTPFWTALVGGRVETRRLARAPRNTRGLLAVGFEGLAPYWLEMEPMLYVSKRGEVSGRFSTSVDLLFTQRLILQPRVETNFAVQRVRELGIGSGVNDVEWGGRLRYEFRREFAPYVGLTWFRRVGETAGLARRAGESVREAGVVVGVRMWR